MTAATKTLHQITQEGIDALYRELGPVDAVRFIRQFTNGYGDYTAERERLFGRLSLDELIEEVRRHRMEREAAGGPQETT